MRYTSKCSALHYCGCFKRSEIFYLKFLRYCVLRIIDTYPPIFKRTVLEYAKRLLQYEVVPFTLHPH